MSQYPLRFPEDNAEQIRVAVRGILDAPPPTPPDAPPFLRLQSAYDAYLVEMAELSD